MAKQGPEKLCIWALFTHCPVMHVVWSEALNLRSNLKNFTINDIMEFLESAK